MSKREGDIWRMERLAKDEDFEGFRFMAMFPAGPRVVKFLDAYFGLIQIEGVTEDSKFVTVRQIDERFPDLHCIALTQPETEETEESAEGASSPEAKPASDATTSKEAA